MTVLNIKFHDTAVVYVFTTALGVPVFVSQVTLYILSEHVYATLTQLQARASS